MTYQACYTHRSKLESSWLTGKPHTHEQKPLRMAAGSAGSR
jgi:hypothetical protein